jgi:hypothetical protein
MKILVTGSRSHESLRITSHIRAWVRDNTDPEERIILIHGGARGADDGANLATEFEKDWGEFRLPARWRALGRSAGPRRNREMIEYLSPDVCLAYPMPDSVGTYDMIEVVEKAGIPFFIFEKDEL